MALALFKAFLNIIITNIVIYLFFFFNFYSLGAVPIVPKGSIRSVCIGQAPLKQGHEATCSVFQGSAKSGDITVPKAVP